MQQRQQLEQIRKMPFFFILGRPRSGTTLLRTLLDAHPNITIPLENSGLIHLNFKYRGVKHWDSRKIKDLLKDFKQLNYIGNWNLNYGAIKDLLYHPSDMPLSFPEIIRVFYYHYQSEFTKQEILSLGDKSPLNSLYSIDLFHLFPDARFIHLVRDYRANLASMSKHDVFSPSSTAMLMQWKKSVNQINKLAIDSPHSFMLLRYEDLVRQPEDSYKNICAFLGVRFMPEILDPEYRKNAVSHMYNQSFLEQWQPALSGEISTKSIDKWKVELPSLTIRKADYIAGKTGIRYAYYPVNSRFDLPFILLTEMKKILFHLNEMNRYIYDRLPYRLKTRIRNRKFVFSYHLIRYFKKHFGKH